MKKLFELGFRNKIGDILLVTMFLIFAIALWHPNLMLAYLLTLCFVLLILLQIIPWNSLKNKLCQKK